jgi:hypothetical protein
MRVHAHIQPSRHFAPPLISTPVPLITMIAEFWINICVDIVWVRSRFQRYHIMYHSAQRKCLSYGPWKSCS